MRACPPELDARSRHHVHTTIPSRASATMLWTRTTSRTSSGSRSARLSPAWGPAPVTSVPVTSSAPPTTSTAHCISRVMPSGGRSGGVRPLDRPAAPAASASLRALMSSTAAFQSSTIDSRKCPMVKRGSSSLNTSSAPSPTWASTPATRPRDNTMRSVRRGRRLQEPSTAAITAMATTPVKSRFTNSTRAWYSRSATKRSSEQVGQSSQPRPDPVRRTATPVTTIAASAHRAKRVSRV